MHKNFRQNYSQENSSIKILDVGAVSGDGEDKQNLREPVVRAVLLGSTRARQPRKKRTLIIFSPTHKFQ